MGLAPDPMYPEKGTPYYQRAIAPSIPRNKGPLRFEEGVATDTDVPNDFAQGAYGDGQAVPGRPSHKDPSSQFKHADETMRERAHVGSASWVEAPAMLSEFADGAGAGQQPPSYELIRNSGARTARRSPTVVED